jgi:cytochrome c heme-lyase
MRAMCELQADSFNGPVQAFEIVARPALDTVESAVDRLKMATYVQCARWGIPCPITGGQGHVVSGQQLEQQQTAQ